MAEDKLIYLDPNDILMDDNSRFALKRYRLEEMKASIVASNGVHTPIEVSPLPKNDPSGKSYRLTAGFYRTTAVQELNELAGAGLTIPAMVHKLESPVERLKRQLSENMERENQSPMDKAIAIGRLMHEGLTKMDIRKIFSLPGGRKGFTMQPASNSHINMHLSFLELPKAIQNLIHDGKVGVVAAYELTKIDPSKREAILERVEKERQAAMDREEAEETKLLEQEKKMSIASEKVEEVKKEAESEQVAADKAAEDLKAAEAAQLEAVDATVEAFRAMKIPGLTPEEKKAAEDKHAAIKKAGSDAEKKLREAQKVAEATAKDAAKAKEKAIAAEVRAQEKAAKMAATRKGAASKAAPATAGSVSPREVRGAARAAGAPATGSVALNSTEMRKVVDELCLPSGYPLVESIGKAFKSCFLGTTTPPQLLTELSKITGEHKAKPGPTAKGGKK